MEGTSRALPHTIKSIGLLGSHVFCRNPNFTVVAVSLARELVKHQIRLTYGGGCIGLQAGVASTVYNNGGLVRGFILTHIVEAFIVLPRGVENTEGLFTLISWVFEGLIYIPIGLLNVGGYFDNLLNFLDEAVTQNFMAVSKRRLFISLDLIDELLDKLEFAKAFPRVDYEKSVNTEGLDLELHL